MFSSFWFPVHAGEAAPRVHHQLRARLLPDSGRIEVVDQLRLPDRLADGAELHLNRGLKLEPVEGLTPLGVDGETRRYRIAPGLAGRVLVLRYGGRPAGLDARTRLGDMPRGVVSSDGVYLDGGSYWYPWLPGSLQTFTLQVEAPDGWRVIAQGGGGRDGDAWSWVESHPQEAIYLLAGRFQVYRGRGDAAEVQVWLREDDGALAKRYLDASADYLRFYSRLIDTYPYAKFAVVENRWQTGYGMPSFTLLGSRVMRLPFILHSSLPHEILHNWWGNGVYVDYRRGNWSEGLTAYLSDYLLRERNGEGASYRRRALERFTNFAADGRDFPLRRFVSRHGDSSQAIGYDKSLMLFHQIRRRLGDERFFDALRNFYREWRFRRATFDDLIRAFERAAGNSLKALVEPLLDGVGAPRLALEQADVARDATGWRLRLRLAQTQDGPLYPLDVPVRVVFEEGERADREVHLDQRSATFDLRFARRPRSVAVDPDYQLFRLLDSSEKPSSLGRLFGAKRQWLILPSKSKDLAAWRRLAEQWQRRWHNVEMVTDDALERLPEDEAVWVLGWDNRFADAALARVGRKPVERGRLAVVWLDPDNRAAPFGWIGAEGAATIAALARKLPHYGSYGELAFALPGARNQLKRRLAVRGSALSRRFSPPAGQRPLSRDTRAGGQ